jgi:hypothetical protein
MTRVRRVWRTLVPVAVLMVATACGGNGSDDADKPPVIDGTSPSSGTSSTPSASPSSTPGSAGLHTSYPSAGLTVDLPRRLQHPAGRNRAVVSAYLGYESALRSTLHARKLDPALRHVASPNLVDRANSTLSYLRSHDATFAGRLLSTVTQLRTSDHLAVLDACLDGQDYYLVENGHRKPLDPPGGSVRVTFTQAGTGWVVSGYDQRESTC